MSCSGSSVIELVIAIKFPLCGEMSLLLRCCCTLTITTIHSTASHKCKNRNKTPNANCNSPLLCYTSQSRSRTHLAPHQISATNVPLKLTSIIWSKTSIGCSFEWAMLLSDSCPKLGLKLLKNSFNMHWLNRFDVLGSNCILKRAESCASRKFQHVWKCNSNLTPQINCANAC